MKTRRILSFAGLLCLLASTTNGQDSFTPRSLADALVLHKLAQPTSMSGQSFLPPTHRASSMPPPPPVIADPFQAPLPTFKPRNQPVNPVIHETMPEVTDVQYDAFGNPIVTIEKDNILRSARDPLRAIVDPGSLRDVDRYEREADGSLIRVTGTEWTSLGTPHSNLTRTKVRRAPGVAVVNRTGVISETKPATIVNKEHTASDVAR